ncbi:hypothetical protein [Chromobacterium sp. IIBBL 290-4]|uniref:hypothetical protein n=1 Tax=Chromobacterium sp. IIBBL 290-4 TaxID=2953890 RepID=UPI0020B7D815|nr:hypothetical protein [Chromobacterium sp. IIBBL 290-4]UTH72387.1 hypothetical protein NKT35_12555 [Chromobacterium sp. IIBBL 290-4]
MLLGRHLRSRQRLRLLQRAAVQHFGEFALRVGAGAALIHAAHPLRGRNQAQRQVEWEMRVRDVHDRRWRENYQFRERVIAVVLE